MNSILRYRWRGSKSKSSEMFFLDFLWWSDCYIFNRWYVFLVVTDILWNESFWLNIHPNRGWPETMRKLCLSTKFPHLEIRWNYGISRSDLFYPYFTQFKELPSPILNFLNFFSGDGTPTHPLKILKNIPIVIADNFQRQSSCKL